MDFDTDNINIDLNTQVKLINNDYLLELDDTTYTIKEGKLKNSFEIFLGNDKIVKLFCGFGNERDNSCMYNYLSNYIGYTVRKDPGKDLPNPIHHKFSSNYFFYIQEINRTKAIDIITKISQIVYIAAQRGAINFDRNGIKDT